MRKSSRISIDHKKNYKPTKNERTIDLKISLISFLKKMLFEETRDKWIKALNHVIHQQNEKKASFNELEWFKDQFRRADKNRNGYYLEIP